MLSVRLKTFLHPIDMNALELADNIATCEPNLGRVATDCADMLRQQQAEIEALRMMLANRNDALDKLDLK